MPYSPKHRREVRGFHWILRCWANCTRNLPGLRVAAHDALHLWRRPGEWRQLPWPLFPLSLVAVMAGHWLADGLADLLRHALGGLITAILAVGVFAICLLLLFLHRYRGAHLTAPLALAVVAGGIAAIAVHHALHLPPLVWTILGLGLLVGVLERVHHWKHTFDVPHTLNREPAARVAARQPFRALILTVSPPTTVPDCAPDRPAIVQAPDGLPIELGADLATAIQSFDKLGALKHNWQQLLRSLIPHVSYRVFNRRDGTTAPLQVWLLFSQSPNPVAQPLAAHKKAHLGDGSALYARHARDFLAPYVGAENIHVCDPFEFEDSEATIQVLNHLLDHQLAGIPRKELLIDITGGFKIVSLVAGLMTLRDDVRVQYVPTFTEASAKAAAESAERPSSVPEAYIYDLRNPRNEVPG